MGGPRDQGDAMFFYGFVVLVILGVVLMLIRSPVFRQIRRGRGIGSAQGDKWDHLAERGLGAGSFDVIGAKRESHRQSKDGKPRVRD